MSERPIEFWFSVGSTYSYLTIMRLPGIAAQSGIDFVWRPFNVRKIMIEQDNVPFAKKPIKAAYMWRDIERRSARYGLPVKVPAPYPLAEFDLANKVAILGRQEGWCADYVQATYRRWFQEGQAAGSEPNLSASLAEIGVDPVAAIKRANDDAIDAAYEAATDEALEKNIFGAPSFLIGTEVFWGDDRLEDAIAFYKGELR